MEDKKDCLIIGEGVRVTGNVSLSGTVYVFGDVSGEIVARELHVGSTGKVTGNVQVDSAEIKGQVLNTIRVKDTLIVRASGKVSGEIAYQSLEIEHGGMIDGKIEKIESASQFEVTAIQHSPETVQK